MNRLDGTAAFAALSDRLRRGTACPPVAEPPLERLRLALEDPSATPMDRAVLLRHALRFQSLRDGVERELACASLAPAVLQAAGLEKRPGAGGRNLAAMPWQPAWLPGTSQPVDETAMRAERRRFGSSIGVPGDPFLQSLGRTSYRSAGQRAAVRAALTMPPGAQLIVDLPTGEGKSAVFAAIDRIGFASDPPGRASGTTLVIVPTITLALDHERSAGGSEVRPLAYVGGRTAQNEAIRMAIEADSQGLCFAAPEAATIPLRHCLGRAAGRGMLRSVVVDEAHLVESWGTGFRTAFQTFAGACRDWARSCPPGAAFRTVLLSATLSEAAEQALCDLFAPGGRIEVVSAAQVRPEIEFWSAAPCGPDERIARVCEAVARLPRPAILYATKVEDAKAWFARLGASGFGRMRLVHGQTPAEEREDVLQQWSKGKLDLVVATSAFGLGVDYPHVRAVLHACVPESFDRFYQEAGRAGRDGCAAMSLVVPAYADIQVAKSLSRKTVIGIERGLERWRAMFRHPGVTRHGHPFYGLRLDAAPSHDPDDIDMVGQRSADWNARTVALMARAGLLKLGGAPTVPDDATNGSGPPRLDVEVRSEGHLERPVWDARVEPKRAEIAEASRASLQMMRTFLIGKACPGRLVAKLYAAGARRTAASCGGCRLCRADPSARAPDGLPAERLPPWPAQGTLAPPIMEAWGSARRLLVTHPVSEPPKRDVQDVRDAVRCLDAWGLRVFACVGGPPTWLRNAVVEAVANRPWFVAEDHGMFPAHWPAGARLAALGPGLDVNPAWLRAGAGDAGMILMVPEGARNADRPGQAIAEFPPCPALSLQMFLGRVLR